MARGLRKERRRYGGPSRTYVTLDDLNVLDQAERAPALRGGYPDPALTLRSSEDRGAWFEGYLRTYLERDLQQLASIDHLVAFQRLHARCRPRRGAV